MKKVLFLILFLTLTTNKVVSQTALNSSFNFVHHNIDSERLNDSVKLVISLPDNYATSDEKYPVVYILDGKWFFSQGVSSQIHFSRFKMTPNLIIIGIENTVRQRRWYTRAAKEFNLFLAEELIPAINKKFRTTQERLLFGWEISGGFVIESLGSTPDLFSAYLAASPGPIDKTFMEHYQYRYDALNRMVNSNNDIKSFLFFTTGTSDYPAQYGVDNLVKLLEENQLEGFHWTYKKLNEETHPTTAFKTIHKGIESYFLYYPVLRFNSVNDYVSAGGSEYLESYYVRRKEKYGFSEERNTSDYLNTCKNIVFKAMSEENYKAFDHYINEFVPKKMLDITHYNHASRFAEFYLKNDNPEMALKLMSYYIDKFPEAARPYHILGNVYHQMGDKKNARNNYLQAVDLGEKNADRRLSEYKNSLEEFENAD